MAVPRLNGTRTGDTLAPKGQPVVVPPPTLPAPALQVAVKPATRADDDKLMSALHRLVDEDPSLTVARDDETHQTILGVSGEVHLAVTLERLDRKCNVHVEREELRIPYRETITRPAEAEGKHKKQSGGHGQFGVCHLRLEPLGRGEGFAFRDEVVGGAIPRQYIPAVEKGVLETFDAGGVHGYPVVDIAVTVDDGKAHSVDSNEVSFKMAAALAVRAAMAEAGPIVLEPISRLAVTIPAECQGDVLGDLHSRRARIIGTDAAADEGYQTVTATAPTAELTRYAVDLRALTGGRGSFTVAYDHYDAVPEHLMASIPPAGADLRCAARRRPIGSRSERVRVLEAHRELGEDQRAQQLVARRRHHGHGQRARRAARAAWTPPTAVKWPVYPATQTPCFLGRSSASRP